MRHYCYIYAIEAIMYIHEKPNWTQFYWNAAEVDPLVSKVCHAQGVLYGRLLGLGFDNRIKNLADNLTKDVVRSSEIEGIELNMDEVRSSVANRLGIENDTNIAPSHRIEAVVEVMVSAMEHYDQLLTDEKLWGWQSAFFQDGHSRGSRLEVGRYRTCEEQVVSGMFGRERVHYEAPKPERVPFEMHRFLEWFNGYDNKPWVIRSAIAHFWFVCIHPFEDGNGRLARILADMQLARGEELRMRFYNVSGQINKDRKNYYRILEETQNGTGDITRWLVWFMHTLLYSLQEAEECLDLVLVKTNFWNHFAEVPLSARQKKILNLYLNGYEGKISSKNWAHLGKCSSDTANRDLQDLCEKGLITCDDMLAKRRTYHLVQV
ncbi:MAG: Fic family protein [Fibrobacter sp.]|nr:Fic family protein [Fibrobacter sp.]